MRRREDHRREPVLAAVGLLERGREGADDADGGDRAERLLHDHRRVAGRADEHGRRVEAARAVRHPAAGAQHGAVVDGVLDLVVDPVALVLVDQRPHLRPGVARVAHLDRLRAARQRGDERLGDLAVHEDALHAGRDLARVGPGAQRGLLRRPLRVDPGVDQHRVLAAQPQQRLAEAVGAGVEHLAAGLHRAGEEHEVHARMRRERTARAGIALHELQDVAQVEQLDEARARQRRLLRRLVDDRVAGHERRRDLPAGDRDRVVPRHEQRHDAARLVDHQVGGVPAPLQAAPAVQRAELGVHLDRGDPGLHAAERVRERLAALAGGELGELLRLGAQPPRGGLQGARALGRGRARPGGLRGAGGTHGDVDGVRRTGRDAPHHVACRGVEDLEARGGAGIRGHDLSCGHRPVPTRPSGVRNVTGSVKPSRILTIREL